MKFFLCRALNFWLRVTLILVGLGYGIGWNPEKDSTSRRISEESLGFGEGEVVSPIHGGISEQKPAKESPSNEPPSGNIGGSLKPSGEAPASSSTLAESFISAEKPKVDTGKKSDLLGLRRDELFERVFKRAPPPRLREYVMRLELDGKDVDVVKILWDSPFKNFQFSSSKLTSIFDTLLSADNRSRVNGVDGHYTSDGLRHNGFGVVADEAEYVLKLSLPPRIKKLSRHDLKIQESQFRFGQEIRPAFFSAYLNSDWTQDWAYGERFFTNDSSRIFWERYAGAGEPKRQPLHVALDGAVRTMDWVVLASGKMIEPENDWGEKSFTRKETRIIRDFPSQNTRLSLLDVTAPHDGSAYSVPPLGGLSLVMGNAIYSQDQGSGGEIQFFLERPAEVVVWVNNEAVRTLRLGSGAHLITGVTGRPGENRVELHVEFPDGTRQNLPFRFTQAAPQILPSGVRNGTFGFGTRRLGENEYGTGMKDLVATTTYRQGLSPFWNAQAGLAVHRDLVVASTGLLWVEDSVTTWQYNLAWTRDSGNKFGYKLGLQYSQQFQDFSMATTAGFTHVSFHNSFFTPRSRQAVRYQMGVSASSQVWKGTLGANANLQLNRRVDSLDSPLDYSFGANYSVAAWRGLNVNAMGNCVIQSGEFHPTASLTMSYFFNSHRHSLYAMNQTFNQKKFNAPKLRRVTISDTLRVGSDKIVTVFDSSFMESSSYENEWRSLANAGWSWSEGMGLVGGKALAISGNYGFDQYGLRVGAQKTANMADFAASYSLTDQNQLGLMTRNHYLSGRMSSSLMFADGVFGLGRRVQDGFILVNGKNTLADTRFRINPSTQYNSEYSRGVPLLAASYGLLSPYRITEIQVKADNPPAGTFLDEDRYYTRNSYKQGFVLGLGKSPRVFVRLRLIDETDQSLGYTTFRVFAASDTTRSIYQSFSSKEGMIQIADLEAGKKYIIRFGEDSFIKDLVITIPMGSPAILNLGDKKIQHETFSQLAKLSLGAPDPSKKTRSVASTPDPVSSDEKSTAADPAPDAPASDKSQSKSVN